MKKVLARNQISTTHKRTRKILYLTLLVFFLKLLIISRITNLNISLAQGHVWLGADGENYLKGVDGLITDGIYSKEGILNYWPAGYPLFIYVLSFFGKSISLTYLAVIQSAIFSFSVYLFGKELNFTKLNKYSFFIA